MRVASCRLAASDSGLSRWASAGRSARAGGPVSTGKTAQLQALCEQLRADYRLGVVTNDIFTREDAEFLIRHSALTEDRIIDVETGGCPHAAIREDISLNMDALKTLMSRFGGQLDYLFVESGGDNLAAHFSRELVDFSEFEHDACGTGFLTTLDGRRSHAIVADALTMLANMEHCGVCGCDADSGDGAGILLQLPHWFLLEECVPDVRRYLQLFS